MSQPRGDNGTFYIRNVQPGVYKLTAISSEQMVAITHLAASGAESKGNQIKIDNHPVNLVVRVSESTATLMGFAKRDGKGTGGVMIVLVPQGFLSVNIGLFRRTQTDSDGSFSLHHVTPGRYTVLPSRMDGNPNGSALQSSRRIWLAD
jgi:hypothetical protein